jgi:esterase/lipase
MKPDLLILHGALGASSQFEELAKALDEDFNVHLLNFEGHGGCNSERDFSIDAFAENVKDYLDKKGLQSIPVFGYSMGGYVSIKLSLTHPGYISKLLTLGTKFNWTPESAAHEVKFLNPTKIEEKVPKFAEMLKKRHQPNDWKEVLQKTADMMLRLGNGEALKKPDFEKVDLPVKIMVGSADTMVSIEESKQVAGWIPGSEFEVLEAVEHPVEKVSLKILSEKILHCLL